MQKLSEEQKQKIIDALTSHGVNLPCPRCGSCKFSLLDGYFNQTLQTELTGGLTLGGPVLPSFAVVCNQCGFMSQHALGVLGLMSAKEEAKREEK
ncbi:MAG: hypothetical protein Q7R57_03665 [Dehalococcoidales bacterium]|nr:hypothetical protein [Dehalococcoidales bacterium]